MAWLYMRFQPSDLIPAPLVRDPVSGWDYSNFSSHLLAVIVARACDADLMDFATEHLFDPLGSTPGVWITDREGYRTGHGDLELSALDMARFGQLHLDGGRFQGHQIVPESWIADPWQPYTEHACYHKVGNNFGRTAYGYQWWIIDAGPHTYHLAWGHRAADRRAAPSRHGRGGHGRPAVRRPQPRRLVLGRRTTSIRSPTSSPASPRADPGPGPYVSPAHPKSAQRASFRRPALGGP